jgi:chromosome segregation ATPase
MPEISSRIEEVQQLQAILAEYLAAQKEFSSLEAISVSTQPVEIPESLMKEIQEIDALNVEYQAAANEVKAAFESLNALKKEEEEIDKELAGFDNCPFCGNDLCEHP